MSLVSLSFGFLFLQTLLFLLDKCHICCVRDGIMNICGWRIPTSNESWLQLKRRKEIESIKCATFREFQSNNSVDVISDDSTHCIICLGDYKDDDMLIYLKCGHHYHRLCGADWLQRAEICPICRQNFRTAKNQRNSSQAIEMKELNLISIIN